MSPGQRDPHQKSEFGGVMAGIGVRMDTLELKGASTGASPAHVGD
jgi:hypothetical protein